MTDEHVIENNDTYDPIGNFLYIVAMTLLLLILPIFQKMDLAIWVTTIIAVIITIMSYYLIKITTTFLKSKITIASFKAKRVPIYLIYFLIYFVIRMTFEI